MGIKNLNKWIKDNCKNAIECLPLSEIYGKKIVVDISIYIYKYEAENALMENMYTLFSLLKYYNINAIFVFDGKPPNEKKQLLILRKQNKEKAKEDYDLLEIKWKEMELDNKNRKELEITMEQLKKQFVYITKEKIEKVKELIIAFGYNYVIAPKEADELCAWLVKEKKVWACLSEDMDLFVYGCKRVLRYISLLNHTVVIYYMKGILAESEMSLKEFKEICILSGTDYNINDEEDNNKINEMMALYNIYKKEKNDYNDFYNWIKNKQEMVVDIDKLNSIFMMFNLDVDYTKCIKNIKITKEKKLDKKIKEIMEKEDFVFL
jgi:hypothetical protein